MDKLKMHSPDLSQSNIEKIKELFPNCVTEATDDSGNLKLAIDFDQLKQELSDSIVEGPQERYQLNWPGKREALLTANAPIAKTLRPCREESVNFDKTENLFIEGDNLEAMKLLQETYLEKIKLIFIDPPYNTGKDFIYKDDFAEASDEFLKKSNQYDDQGLRLVSNLDSNGRFHSNWLTMIYSRLKLAKNLLSEDGVIFISIDDSEQENLKKVCDEIFGQENYVNTISINLKNVAGASGGGEDKRLKKNVEYVLVYAKCYDALAPFESVYEYRPIGELVEEYRQEGRSWKYTSVLFNSGGKKYIASTVDGDGNEIKIYERVNATIKSIGQIIQSEKITEQEAYDKYGHLAFQTAMPQSSIRPRVMNKVQEIGGNSDLYSIEYVPRSGRNKGKLYEQFYKGEQFRLFAWLKDVSIEINGHLYKKEMQGTYWDFVSETKNLTKEGGVPFQNGKKPLKFLSRIIDMMNDPNMTVLDFFAGSASTAHAVMERNFNDDGKRKYIMVQLPEECDAKSEAFKLGFRKVSDLSTQRIKNAALKLQEQSPSKSVDIGFRLLKTDSSNMTDIFYQADQINQTDMFAQVENIKEGRTDEDLLFQVLLDWGVGLTLPISKQQLATKDVFFVNANENGEGADLIACFGKDISNELIKALAEKQPLRVVFRDDGFANDSVKINVEQIFKQISPMTDVKSI